MTLVYGSVCSGIEAVTCAWHPLGRLKPRWFSEIAEFPSKVLAHRWPGIPNLGDFTKIGSEHGPIDVLVGGTPCTAFSIAGRRAGLDDPRGHLAIEFLLLAHRLGARWVVWENVPGVFSIDGGETFATFLRLMVECGYGVTYRVLDAQHFGVPQRRRRVFVVGHLGDWRPSAAVLLERPSMRRDPRARGKEGTSVATAPTRGARGASGGEDVDRERDGADGVAHAFRAKLRGGVSGASSDQTFVVDGEVARTLTSHAQRNDATAETFVVDGDKPFVSSAGKSSSSADQTFVVEADVAATIGGRRGATPQETFAVLPMTRRGDHAVFAFDEVQITSGHNRSTVSPGGPVPTVSSTSRMDLVDPACFSITPLGGQGSDLQATEVDVATGLQATSLGASTERGVRVVRGGAVRRLTPTEVERCFGFEDGYTLIPGASDSARYEALGNSMAVPVMRWIGERILKVEDILRRSS